MHLIDKILNDSKEMKAESIKYKFSLMKLDEHGEYSEDIGTTNSFEEMLTMVKKGEKENGKNNN